MSRKREEGGREGGRERGREGGREGGRERGKEGGREGKREGERGIERERERERGRDRERDRDRLTSYFKVLHTFNTILPLTFISKALRSSNHAPLCSSGPTSFTPDELPDLSPSTRSAVAVGTRLI